MKVDILTPKRQGGPFNWAKDLASVLQQEGNTDARHVYSNHDLLSVPLHATADIVHTTIPIPFKLWRKPVVMTVKGDYTVENNRLSRFYPGAVKRADIVTVPSLYLKDRLGLDKATVIPNAILPERFVVRKRKEHAVRLATICNMYFKDKTDGLIHLIDTLRLLSGAIPIMTIAGDGKYREYAEKQAQGANVRFVGHVDDVRLFLRSADVFLYHSTHDNFPNVILEAMVSGLPVVTNRVGAVEEIIESGKDGYVAYNDDEYLCTLEHLVENAALREKIGNSARLTVESKFNWHNIVKQYVGIYERLISAAKQECEAP